MKFFVYIMLLNIINVISIIPNQNFNKKFKFNKLNPNHDLQIIDHIRSDLISKKWLDDVVIKVVNDYSKNLETTKPSEQNLLDKSINSYSEVFMVTEINEFRKLIEKNNKYLYLSWMPNPIFGVSDILYLIIVEEVNDQFTIRFLLHSPYWDENQIDSIYLKKSLTSLAQIRKKKIDFNYLYSIDIRHKLSWNTWSLE